MPDPAIVNILKDNPFFGGLSEDIGNFLAEHASRRQIASGKILFHHGDPARHFFLVLEGHVALEIPAIEGPTLELQDIGPGHVAGWSWLIPPNRWHFQARARTDVTCLEFDGAAVLERCEADPRFGYALLKRFSKLMSERLDFARQKMMQEWKPAGFA